MTRATFPPSIYSSVIQDITGVYQHFTNRVEPDKDQFPIGFDLNPVFDKSADYGGADCPMANWGNVWIFRTSMKKSPCDVHFLVKALAYAAFNAEDDLFEDMRDAQTIHLVFPRHAVKLEMPAWSVSSNFDLITDTLTAWKPMSNKPRSRPLFEQNMRDSYWGV
ncbi:MAG: hypothetical protein HC892_00045 [Saprospiraceae bacterium]|nr:hypothetical protein [Saprospiraceae bacterium]